jgi:hypothetical protein
MPKRISKKTSPENPRRIRGLFGTITVAEAPKGRGRPPKRQKFVIIAVDEPHMQPEIGTRRFAGNRGHSRKDPITRSTKSSTEHKKVQPHARQKQK